MFVLVGRMGAEYGEEALRLRVGLEGAVSTRGFDAADFSLGVGYHW